MSRRLREIAAPFVAASPAGVRVRTRLRVSGQDEVVLRAVGRHLGSLDTGAVPVTRGGKNLLRKRNNLAHAGLTEAQWRDEWEASRLFLTADGEAAKLRGNETIRVSPDEGWLELKLPAPLAGLANRPSGRYRLACAVEFSHRETRSPPRHRPGRSATTSAPTRRPAAGTSTPAGRSPPPRR